MSLATELIRDESSGNYRCLVTSSPVQRNREAADILEIRYRHNLLGVQLRIIRHSTMHCVQFVSGYGFANILKICTLTSRRPLQHLRVIIICSCVRRHMRTLRVPSSDPTQLEQKRRSVIEDKELIQLSYYDYDNLRLLHLAFSQRWEDEEAKTQMPNSPNITDCSRVSWHLLIYTYDIYVESRW